MWRAASGSSFSFSWTCKAEGHGVRIARRNCAENCAENCARGLQAEQPPHAHGGGARARTRQQRADALFGATLR